MYVTKEGGYKYGSNGTVKQSRVSTSVRILREGATKATRVKMTEILAATFLGYGVNSEYPRDKYRVSVVSGSTSKTGNWELSVDDLEIVRKNGRGKKGQTTLTPRRDDYADEVWKCVPGKDVLVSSHNRYRSPADGEVRELNPTNPNCYTRVKVMGEYHMFHRLVALAFYGPPAKTNYVVDHRDGDRCNNHPLNLSWVSISKNNVNRAPCRSTARVESRDFKNAVV